MTGRSFSLVIVFYISGHGFGHATRELEVIRHIHQQQPDARIVVRTTVPRWFLERSAKVPIDVQVCEADTGMVQIDSLRLDETATAQQAVRFYSTFQERVTAEAAVLEQLAASVVVGDVPPLAFASAARAGVPSVAVANFTWDWIYAVYPVFQTTASHVLHVIGDAYANADHALRLPFAGGLATMRSVRDVPLVARRSRRTREENRRLLELDAGRPIVLASFGGHGAALPYDRVAARHDITLVVTDYEARAMGSRAADHGRLRCFAGATLAERDLRYEDLVAAADVVVSKPGYGIVSECIANQTALLYTSRGVFAENDVIIAGMQAVLRNRFISQDELRSGQWGPSIEALVAEPAPLHQMPTNGAQVVASAISDIAGKIPIALK